MESATSADELKENDAPELRSDKKTDEIIGNKALCVCVCVCVCMPQSF